MALATRCPACSTVFRISTAQATAKGGTVRCGQCRHVFNSLDALVRVEDLEVIEEVQVAQQPTSGDVASAVEAASDVAGESVEPTTLREGDEAAASPAAEPFSPDAAAPDAAAPENSGEASPVEAHDAASGQPPNGGEWWLPDPADVPAPPLAAPAPSTDRDDAGRVLSGRGDRDLEAIGVDAGVGSGYLLPVQSPSRLGRRARWAIGIGALVGTIVLLGQLAYLWRDEIAARWTTARPWLTAACVPLRCTVGYPAHLEWITIESATIQTTGAGLDVYVLNALLRNRASSDVRYPHLELVLTDLQDRPILRRALRPEDYLPQATAAGRDAAAGGNVGFPADSELPIHLTFELGDFRFAGYRVDKFYP